MDELLEQLKIISNLIYIANVLIKEGEIVNIGSPLATILELLHQETQSIIDEYCVVKNGKRKEK